MNNLSDNLKKIRKDNNLSQEQLADVLGVSRQAISKWESGVAYPEMEKLVQICQKFDVNIDDLLNKDIREVKSEEESKKSINKYLDDFLKFISDTVNLFSCMNLKSKLKCLLEQFILIIILAIIFTVIGSIFSNIAESLFSVFGNGISYRISDLLFGIYLILAFIISAIILIHVFKTRYLDYFNETMKNNTDSSSENDTDKVDKKNEKIEFNNDNDKIVIRDPKHSEYRFINGFFKIIILFIKFFALLFALSLCFCLVCFLIVFTISFLFIKTGFVFVGFILSMISISVGTIVVLLLLFNFIFNRKNDKKKMIFTFISAIIVFGFGCGLIFIGSLKFNYVENDESLIVTKNMEIEMSDNLVFSYLSNVQYVEKDIDNVVVEYDINKFFSLSRYSHEFDDLYQFTNFYVTCSDPMNALRYSLDKFNDLKIVNMDVEADNVKIYANAKNINIIKNNISNYEKMIKEVEDRYNSYQEEIDDLNDIIEEKDEELDKREELLDEKEEELTELKDKISDLQDKIDSLRYE